MSTHEKNSSRTRELSLAETLDAILVEHSHSHAALFRMFPGLKVHGGEKTFVYDHRRPPSERIIRIA